MVGITIGLAAATWVSICFMDAPWFRLPVTLFFDWGSSLAFPRTLVLGVMGRLLAVVLAPLPLAGGRDLRCRDLD